MFTECPKVLRPYRTPHPVCPVTHWLFSMHLYALPGNFKTIELCGVSSPQKHVLRRAPSQWFGGITRAY